MDADVFRQHSGVSYRQLDTWTKAGHLKTSGEKQPGSGTPRSWDAGEAVVARSMLKLTKAGVALGVAADVARQGEGEFKLGDGVLLRFTP